MDLVELERSIIKKYRKEIWACFVKAVKEYNMIKSKWNGDYLVTYYSNETENVEYWENMELSIPSQIIFKY